MNNKERLKVGFLTPYFHNVRGNATTAKRIVSGLESVGVEVVVFAYEEEEFTSDIETRLKSCDVLHILHFYRFANWQMKHHFQLEKPYVMTSGGTDINHDLFDNSKRLMMESIINNASAITVFTDDGLQKVEKAFPTTMGKISVVPQSVWFPPSTNEDHLDLPDGFPKLLLPAGLRPVKDVLFLMDILVELKKGFPKLQFILVGTILDDKVYEQVKAVEKRYRWVKFLRDVPLEMMPAFYKWSDAVLNTSISEGQSSAILEGMYFNKLIFARKNAGNVSVITDNENGFLYDSSVDFYHRIQKVLLSVNKEKQIALNGKFYVEKNHNHKVEIEKYTQLYNKIT
ncbi:hypothetical protein CIB95_12940 [Lottiidibacillus patelloidae]|uniref:Glycosyl transferase family 1 domain-containing protein n=1 Tax=Lottiidibacillus patelloidae TaxID=2670334 RepID=A0A263BRJ4_9BACI|nr:glycosyltransferase [Lottiidibacillus patelloidae]OZM56315.1 hypothetical protein CIB95_12940 [Lottiidibacillus patelloidae]